MGQESKAQKPPRKKQSGSEQRKLQPRITFRVDDMLRAKAGSDAAAAGLTVGSYMRLLLGDRCSIRPRRRPLPNEILLAGLRAEAGQVDGNLAQLLRQVNRGELIETEELEEASAAVRDFYRRATALLVIEV